MFVVVGVVELVEVGELVGEGACRGVLGALVGDAKSARVLGDGLVDVAEDVLEDVLGDDLEDVPEDVLEDVTGNVVSDVPGDVLADVLGEVVGDLAVG